MINIKLDKTGGLTEALALAQQAADGVQRKSVLTRRPAGKDDHS